ncbi:putative beta-carotene isomerase [Helianthus annuus]|nr:putative beta-carotene isomerase [Helianthus annuus]
MMSWRIYTCDRSPFQPQDGFRKQLLVIQQYANSCTYGWFLDFDDMSCEMIYGQDPPALEDDPVLKQPCYKLCMQYLPSHFDLI